MPTLTIKNVPQKIVARLRERARRNHRSMQGELMALMESAMDSPPRVSTGEFLRRIKALKPPASGSSVGMIREDRGSH